MRKPNRRRFRNTRQNSNFAWDYNGNDLSPADEKLLTAASEGDIAGVKSALKAGANVNVEDDTGYTPLDLATGEGDFEAVKVLVQAGANLNTPYNPFLNAVFIDRNMARYLAQRGADINGTGNSGDTALETAIYNGDARDVSFLLDLGVDPNFDNPDSYLLGGRSPVIYAAQTGLLEILKLLVEAGADVPEEALELAEEEGCTKTASYLRSVIGESRRDRNFSSYTDEEGDTLEEKVNIFRRLVYDGMSGPREIIHWLQYIYGQYVRKLPQGNPDREAIVHLHEVFSYLNGDTKSRPASLAVYKDAEVARRYYDKCIQDFIKRQKRTLGKFETDGLIGFVVNAKPVFTDDGYYRPEREVTDLSEMEKYIQSGANVNAKVNGHSLVWVAICRGQWAIAKCLLKHHAKAPMEQDQFGNTAIMIAAIRGYGDIIPLLVDNGGDVSQQTLNGESPLSVSIRDHDADFVKMLIDCGADVNSRNDNNYTPLMNAANRGRVDVAQMLIDAGADINVLNDNNETALSIAERRTKYLPECAEVAELLRSVGAKSARTLLIEKDTGRKRQWNDESKKYDDIRFDLVTDALYEVTPEQYKWADEAAELAYAIKDNSMLRITDLEFTPYANDPMKFWIHITPATNADKYVVKAAIKGSLPSNVKIVEERNYDNDDPTISYALSLV